MYKRQILKAAREKETVTYKGVPIRLSADFSKETLETRRKKETSNQKRMKKQEFKKMRRGLGTSRASLNVPASEL